MAWQTDWQRERLLMVENQIRRRGVADERVLSAMCEVPRERFVPEAQRRNSYADEPLPIGAGQTISQPYIVAYMVELLDCRADLRVLDVGAGSGYQTAVLSRLAEHVYAVERVAELAERAQLTLCELGVENVTLAVRDGSIGWPEHAPFDRIICGALAPDVPRAWIDQLADGGRIVAPVGDQMDQRVVIMDKIGGHIRRTDGCGVRFVKLIGEQAFPED